MSNIKGVILLEGPDGTGKSTLADFLVNKFDGHYVHRTWRRGMDVWDHHTEALQIANERAHQQLVVIDRLWPSEAIYGNVFRKESDYKHNSRAMDRVLLRMAAIYVLCVPSDPDYVRAVHKRKAGEGLEMYTNIDQVIDRYQHWTFGDNELSEWNGDICEQQAFLGGFLDQRPNDSHWYDVTRHGGDLENVATELEHKLAHRQATQFPFALDPKTPNCLGHRADAKYLFVGEQVGDLHAWSRWPFYARSHSPDFINKSLHEIAFAENEGVWTNAWDEDNRLPYIYAAKPELKVIALGRKAERRCQALRVPVHAALPHPSWARRFNHYGQRGTPYPQLLNAAVFS